MDWIEILLNAVIGFSIGVYAAFFALLLVHHMSTTPEKKVKQKMVKYLKEMGAYYFFPVAGRFGKSGVPDIVCCIKGMFVGLECKAGGNKTTALQELELENIRKAGGTSYVVNENNIDEVASVLFILSEMAVPGEMQEIVKPARAQVLGIGIQYTQGYANAQQAAQAQLQNQSNVGLAQQVSQYNMRQFVQQKKYEEKMQEAVRAMKAQHLSEEEQAIRRLEEALKQKK